MQGQLSNDLRLLTPSRAQISSYSNPKGRMLAVLHLIRSGEALLLEVHRSVAEATLKRLRMFVMRAKVTLELDPGLSALGLIGAELLSQLDLPAPSEPLECSARDGLVLMRRAGALPRWSLHGPLEQLATLAAKLPAGDFADWKRAELRAGVPTVYPDSRELFVPQMANLDALGGISFNKGCYTGQEIVARLHYLGQLKRRMFLCHAAVAEPRPGTPVYDGAGDAQAVGEVVDAVADGDASLLNVVLQLSHAGSTQLRLGAVDGPALGPAQALI
ncbi:MAG TPA: hypothetical protein VLI06_13945 [Solimonas sp.]|nr:hypothetical protein [Solimonas sp.]